MHLIIQARMSSTRLPGKILMKIDGRSLLEWQYLRLKKYVNKIDDIIIATSIEKSDDPVEEFCDNKKIACYSIWDIRPGSSKGNSSFISSSFSIP